MKKLEDRWSVELEQDLECYHGVADAIVEKPLESVYNDGEGKFLSFLSFPPLLPNPRSEWGKRLKANLASKGLLNHW